jgi:hypothetical protein
MTFELQTLTPDQVYDNPLKVLLDCDIAVEQRYCSVNARRETTFTFQDYSEVVVLPDCEDDDREKRTTEDSWRRALVRVIKRLQQRLELDAATPIHLGT